MNLLKIASLGLSLALAGAAQAAPTIYNNSIFAGTTAFRATVTSAGGTVHTDFLDLLVSGASSWARGAFTITSTNGTGRSIDTGYLAPYGDSIGINPAAPASGSGLTFTFGSPINAFGLMIGDWATCCYLPSQLFISFNGGATKLVASASGPGDNPGFVASGEFKNFVAAIDTSATFSTVSFYGDGFGEFLVAGGTIYYAALEVGSVSDVPEPVSLALFGAGLLGLAAVRRRKAA